MYGSTTDNPPLPDVSKQDIHADVEALRASFDTGAMKDVKTRKSLLRSLQKLLNENETIINDAVWKDLHKHSQELFATEIALIHSEIQYFLDYLDDWSKPKLKATNVLNLPGLTYIRPEPLGVVCVIGTWNYPLHIVLLPLVAALGAGNCAVVRLPGDDTTRFLNNVLIQLFDKYIDKNYVRVVYGGLEETRKMLQERYDLIFATGGNFLAKSVAQAAAQFLTPTVLELGGKSPCIIDDTADLKLAAKRIAWGAFVNAGQTCVRPDYLLVDERVGDSFVEMLEVELKEQYGDENVKHSDSYGRVINQRMYDRLVRILDDDRKHVTYGADTDAVQRFISPTLLNFRTNVDLFTSSASMKEEIFGPLLPIFYYTSGDLNVPIKFVTGREKPLAAYHFSSNSNNKERVVSDISAGSIMINDVIMQLSNLNVPFGGVGNSGMGAYHGYYGFEAFSHYKGAAGGPVGKGPTKYALGTSSIPRGIKITSRFRAKGNNQHNQLINSFLFSHYKTVIYKNGLLDLKQRYAPYNPAKKYVLSIVMYPFTRLQLQLLHALGLAVLLAIFAIIFS